MTDKTTKYDTLTVTQGTSDYFQGLDDFGKNLNLLKDKILEFFDLKNVNVLLGSRNRNGAIPTMSKLFSALNFTKGKKEIEFEFKCI